MAARLASLLLWAAVLTQAVVTGRTDGRIVAGEGAHARRLLGGVAAGVAPAQAPAARLRGSTQGSPLASRFASVSAGGSRPETQFGAWERVQGLAELRRGAPRAPWAATSRPTASNCASLPLESPILRSGAVWLRELRH